MNNNLDPTLIGAGAAILGGIVGGWASGLSWFFFERKRAENEKMDRDRQRALDWASSGRKYSLQGANLKKSNLHSIDLAGADLRGANLTGANLSFANLENAKLMGSCLKNCRLIKARMKDAICIDANFENALLVEAVLTSAKLGNANLKGTKLWQAFLAFADMPNCSLDKADLRGAILNPTFSLVGAHLEGADLYGASINEQFLNNQVFFYDENTRWPPNFTIGPFAQKQKAHHWRRIWEKVKRNWTSK
jgi:hypothetical protein